MKKKSWIPPVIIAVLLALITTDCKKDDPVKLPVVTTTPVTEITATTAKSGGKITSGGAENIAARGVCWSTNANPTTADSKTVDPGVTAQFTSSIIGLNGGETYHVRAYATNTAGTAYGADISFTTLGQIATCTSLPATNITAAGATLNGSVNANYLSTTVTFEYGTTTGYGSTATAAQSPVSGNTSSDVSADITGLTALTTYHYRVKAVNSMGTVYGEDLTLITPGSAPAALTHAATNITISGATLNGSVNANNSSTTVTFEYGATTSYGNTANASPNIITGTSITNVSANINALTAGQTYHFRIKAVNSTGTSYGEDMTFSTSGQLPSALTQAASNITSTSVTLNGLVGANGASTVVTFEYGLTTAYGSVATAAQSPVTGTSLTNVSANISSLTAGVTYHFRVKAVNFQGTSYGDDMAFITSAQSASCLTQAATGISAAGATLNGTVNANGLSTVVSFEYGLTASYGSSVVAAQSPVTGNTITNVNAVISGLTAGTTYHYRVKAVNTIGTTNGNDVTFTTLNYPTVSTATITNLTTNSATSGGNITSNGGSAVTARGVCWSTSANPTTALATKTADGSGSGIFTSSITGLASGTAYHVRAYATNSVGTAYGNDITLTTTPAGSVPVVTTTAVTLITLNSAISGGNVTSDGGAAITVRGVVWSTTTGPTIALATKTAETGTTGSFVSSITGLTAATTYFLRAYATNSIGTSYGAEMSFVTQSSGSVTDRENNVYNTITIGTQRWMTENLKVTTFNDGTLIPNVTDQSAWGILTTPAYCWYNNDILLKDTYGALYSWFAVDNASNGGRNVCPVGWHVSSDAEWNTLAQYLTDNGFGYGGSGNDIAKSLAANSGWNISAIEGGAGFNQANNNSSGFSAVPAGVRDATQFQLAGSLTRWWVPAGSDPDVSWIRQIQSDDSLIPRNTQTHEFGYAIRCIED